MITTPTKKFCTIHDSPVAFFVHKEDAEAAAKVRCSRVFRVKGWGFLLQSLTNNFLEDAIGTLPRSLRDMTQSQIRKAHIEIMPMQASTLV